MRFGLLLLLFLIVSTAQAQQFSQYNTGTLFDSFEHPAQRAFIPDSSRQFAFNFFIPNFGGTGTIAGNGQNSIKSYINTGDYNNAGLTNGFQNRSNLSANVNTYWFMLKMYNRLNSDQEFGISAQTKAEGRGTITDETMLLLDSYRNFNNGTNNQDLFNDRTEVQAYHQLSLTFRQKVSSSVTFGVKLSALFGIYYNKIDIQNSSFYFNNANSHATLYLKGTYLSSYAGEYRKRYILGLQNPGAAVSFGLQAMLNNGILLQGNLKDLGFIRWNKSAVTYQFNNSGVIENMTAQGLNDRLILTKADSITGHNGSQHAFYSPTDGKAAIDVSKKFNLLTADFYYTPTLIASKNLFYNGLTAAFVNHFTYKNVWFTALASYNNDSAWDGGLQLMYKSPNAEFYVGTEQLFASARFINTNNTAAYASTGMNAYFGFSVKFGRAIKHPANASYIPIGEPKGFFDKIWRHIFKPAAY